MNIETLVVGSMAANCYLLQDPETREIVIIDPGEDANYIAEQVVKLEGTPIAIVATHGHFDHILGACELQLTFNIPFIIHSKDTFLVARMRETAEHFLARKIIESPPIIDKTVSDGEVLEIGKTKITVIHTPGHTPGSICLYSPQENAVFTGDTIFAGGAVGRTDFSYSDKEKLNTSLERIFQLPDATRILPGHGEATSIAAEKLYYFI